MITIAHFHVWDQKNKGDHAIVLAVQELLEQALGKIKFVDLAARDLRELNEKILKKVNRADLVVVGGGGIYYEWFMPFDSEGIKKIEPPLVLYSIGYIRMLGMRRLAKTDLETIRTLNERASFSSVRDFHTKQFLIRAGVPKDKIQVIGDPAIFLSEQKTRKIPFPKNRPKIGLNACYHGWMKFGQFEKPILESLFLAGQTLSQKHHAKLYYMKQHPDEEYVIKNLQDRGLDLTVVDLPPRQQKWAYRQLDLLIGMMMHSAVLSFGAETPQINIGYDIKNRSFAKYIGMRELMVRPRDLEPGSFSQMVENIFQQRDSYQHRFAVRKASIWRKQEKFLEQVKQLVTKS
ncbi:MAG: polysaccharide pyruvyl transferase family protein [bacterium]|nr:polysaccharide pyruvyl transferase family protein [bacterium]